MKICCGCGHTLLSGSVVCPDCASELKAYRELGSASDIAKKLHLLRRYQEIGEPDELEEALYNASL